MTPVWADVLRETKYDLIETNFIVDGFRNGFDIGYRGPIKGVRRFAPNLQLRVGNKIILWNKVMSEVKAGRYAGPYTRVPFDNFIQSPIGLVPKDHDADTRLIFHLSYPRTGISVNSETPKEFCSVAYPDFGDAIRLCMEFGDSCAIGKSDMKSAFRQLGVKPSQWNLLILAAISPFDGKWKFGSSISCSHFQRVSNGIAHIVKIKSGNKANVNYLDDYLFADLLKSWCNQQISLFLEICDKINFPVSLNKTEWSTTLLPFLGLLIGTVKQIVAVPVDKVERAQILITTIIQSKKVTVKTLQKLCGFLNFLCRCIVPGRAFTRRLYSYIAPNMAAHRHINVSRDMKQDLWTWLDFLNTPDVYCRPFFDFSVTLVADKLDWYTDASGKISYAGYHRNQWFQSRWPKLFLDQYKPSIEYQELFAVAVSVLLWAKLYENCRICLFCDNETVVKMLKNISSSCKNCMILIRMIVRESLKYNMRIFAEWVSIKDNYLADAISRFEMDRVWRDVNKDQKVMDSYPTIIPECMDPELLWIK